MTNPFVAGFGTAGDLTALHTGYTGITAVSGALSASASLTVLSTPRYLYTSSDVGRDLTRMALNSVSGQPAFLGYQKTGNVNNWGFDCLTTDPSGTHAYLASQLTPLAGAGNTGIVSIYHVDPASGQLTRYSANPFPVSFPVGCINFLPNGAFAYAAAAFDGGGDLLATFSVNPDGTLTQQSAITLPSLPGPVAIDPLGQYLYVTAQDTTVAGSAYAYGFAVDSSTGGLTPIAGTPFLLPQGFTGSFSFHPSGNFIYLSNQSATSITEYTVDRSSGMLSPVASGVVNPCINPLSLEFSPDGSHAYVNCSEDNNRSIENAPLVSFSVGSGGQLTQIATALAGPASGQMAVDPSGKFIYLPGSGTDYVSTGSGSDSVARNCLMVYRIGSDGSAALVNQIAGRTQLQSLLLAGGNSPVTITPTYAYIGSLGDNSLTSYSINVDGTLNTPHSASVLAGSAWAAMLPWGSDLFLASSATAPYLTPYAIDNGAFTAGLVYGPVSAPSGLALDPSGDIAFQSNAAGQVVYQFGYNGTPGEWGAVYSPTPPTLLTYTAGAGAGPLVTDPAGRYLFIANQTAKSISIVEYAGSAPIPPVSLAYTPLALAVDPTGNLLLVSGDDNNLHLLSSNGLGQLADTSHAALLGNSPSIAIEPTGHFVYAAGVAGLSALSIDPSTHALTPISPISLSLPVSLAGATGVFIDPSGKFLYVPVSTGSLNALYLFTINANGTLSSSGATPVASPNHAASIVFSEHIE